MQELKDYRLLDNWGMTKDLAIKLHGLGSIAFFVFSWLFGALYFWITGNTASIYQSATNNALVSTLIFIIVLLSTLAIHELFHGLFIKKYGAKPVYGAGIAYNILPYFYATPQEKTIFTRKKFIAILLAPLVGISAIGIVLMLAFPSFSHWLLFPLIFNASGAVGDVWMTRTLLRYPKHIMIADDKNGMTIYGKKDDKPLNIEPSGFIRVFTVNTLKFFLMVATLMIFLPIALAILKVNSFTIGPKDSIFTIYEHTRSDSGGSFTIGNATVIATIMLSALAGLIQTVLKTGSKSKKK